MPFWKISPISIVLFASAMVALLSAGMISASSPRTRRMVFILFDAWLYPLGTWR